MKTLLAILVIVLTAGIVSADCTVTVNWTPSASPDVTQQQVIYFDGAAEVVKQTFLDNTTATHAFTIPVPTAGDYVFIRSSNGTDTADSAQVPVGGVAPATGCTAITICQ